MNETTITTPEQAAKEMELKKFLSLLPTKKFSKKARRGTPGAFGKCKNWPKAAYREEAIQKIKDTVERQITLIGEADPKLVEVLNNV